MLDALYIAATGMQSQQMNLETISNNLTNVNTPGFKKSRINFSDLVVNEYAKSVPGDLLLENVSPSLQNRTGMGVTLANLSRVFELGDIKKTESPLDVAIQGDGFFEVRLADGSRAYTRGGTLRISRDGLLVTPEGHALTQGTPIPENTESLILARDGRIQAKVPTQGNVELGQLEIVRFLNPQGLVGLGDGLYRPTTISGEPIQAKAGEDGVGWVAQGFLESSNVKLVDEFINMMLAQRAYEASAKVVQASDEMLGIINGLRK